MSSATFVVAAAALAFIAMGLVALARPAHIMTYFGVTTTPDLRNEVRAVYGGFGLALGGLMLWTLTYPALADGVRVTAAVSLLGMAAGRIVSWCMERSGLWPWLFGAFEIAAGAALLLVPV